MMGKLYRLPEPPEEVAPCEHCGQPIMSDEVLVVVGGMPYHEACSEQAGVV